jgi:hypothetical protein
VAAAQPELRRRAGLAIVTAVVAAGVAGCGDADERPRPSPPTQVPAAVERAVHRTLHGLPRVCSRRRSDASALDRTTASFLAWYRRYPADRYEMTIDDERGTMLSAILVVRYELARCSPRHAAEIDPVLPGKVRAALTPLRRGSP